MADLEHGNLRNSDLITPTSGTGRHLHHSRMHSPVLQAGNAPAQHSHVHRPPVHSHVRKLRRSNHLESNLWLGNGCRKPRVAITAPHQADRVGRHCRDRSFQAMGWRWQVHGLTTDTDASRHSMPRSPYCLYMHTITTLDSMLPAVAASDCRTR